MKTPRWFLKRNLISYALYPLTWFYWIVSKLVFYIRQKHEYIPRRVVICFGNILSGGVGKTPMVRNMARFFDAPVVMRGYKKTKGTDNIGDEAKMLSSDGILVHVGDRKSNLMLLDKQKSNTPIIMDDGFQNSGIKKDISILVFDEEIGFGNGFLLPAGPLREKESAIRRADAIIVIKRKKISPKFALLTSIPLFYATNKEICPYSKDTPVVVFAGIGYPEKFFNNVPVKVVGRCAYPDHYQYTDEDIEKLIKMADNKNAKLLTTEKDWVRLPDWAKDKIKYSKLDTQIEDSFYDWIKGKVHDVSCKKN
jgi:tetraacyldisaccharide 4'-kinase